MNFLQIKYSKNKRENFQGANCVRKTSCWLKKIFNKLNEELRIVKDKNMEMHIFRNFFIARVVK